MLTVLLDTSFRRSGSLTLSSGPNLLVSGLLLILVIQIDFLSQDLSFLSEIRVVVIIRNEHFVVDEVVVASILGLCTVAVLVDALVIAELLVLRNY